MKKILLLLAVVAFVSCGNDDAPPQEPEQDYTSFVFYHDLDITLINCVVGSFDPVMGTYHKIAQVGDLPRGTYSSEVILQDNIDQTLHLFCDNYLGIKLRQEFTVRPYRKNTFVIYDGVTDQYIDKEDPSQYPS